jgi:glycosyltransferase involved in cell wall biosynthesis
MTRLATSVRTTPARVLVSTLAPGLGGVDAMTAFVVNTVATLGLEPVIGHYAPYRIAPALSVPSFRLLQRKTASQLGIAYAGRESHAIGAWLPELEFTHHLASRHWRGLMQTCDAFVAVSGNVLAATPFLQTGRPYLAWVASDWQGDREDRVRAFPPLRRWFDSVVVAPVVRRLERALLRSGRILSLSEHTAAALAKMAGPDFPRVTLPVAIDTDLFTPAAGALIRGRLGFAGRFNDPRKNIALFLTAVQLLRQQGHEVSAVLIGDTAGPAVIELVEKLGLGLHVTFMPGLSRPALRDCMQTLDVFVLPSHQEGLGISALEALACGVPVVSTRCGGPEEFVIPGVTGELAGSTPSEMADRIAAIISDRELRSRMSQAARQIVEDRYSIAQAQATFVKAFQSTFPQLVGH